MHSLGQIVVGAILVALGWMIVRRFAGATLWPNQTLVLDAIIPLAAFVGCVALTGKPVICGIGLFALLCAIARADRLKRRILREPILFYDVYQTIDVLFRHPQVDILAAANWRSAVTMSAGMAATVAAMWLEPALWRWTPLPAATFLLLLSAIILAVRGPLLMASAIRLRSLGATGDPRADAARLGFFAMQIVHVMLARAERAERRAASRMGTGPALRRARSNDGCPVILIQSESFFDARRLDRRMPSDLLPAFDRHCRSGIQWGRLAVPGFGGNTMRTEFAVLTGMTEAAIGFDRFNPYQALARRPIGSLAWRLRSEGYRTICIHPFDRRFYRRDIVMENLGFDAFLGEEAFARPAPPGGYIPDSDVAALTLDLLRDEGPKVFIFAITMQNHGPWSDRANRFPGAIYDRVPVLAGDRGLSSFAAGLHESDRMLELISAELAARGDDGVIAFYGDHLPGFSATFEKLGFVDQCSDYVITRCHEHVGRRIDLAAHELSDAILDALVTTARFTDRPRVAAHAARTH
jgi:hypothetical protein